MTTSTLKKFWKNEYFQTAVTIILIFILVFGFWYGLRLALKTDSPVLAVVSRSMTPVLNVGDLIIIESVPSSQINANPVNGDILVFKNPGNPQELIVHRAVNKTVVNGHISFITEGDYNYPVTGPGSPTPAENVIGKVIARVPYLGNISLFMQTGDYIYLIIFVIIILVIITVIPPFTDDEQRKTGKAVPTKEKRKILGKLGIDTIYLLIVNLLVIGFIAFSIWGAFTFWQPGAVPAQYVTVYGMYPDLQFHKNYEVSHHISGSSLSVGFLTYRVDSLVSDGSNSGLRPGVQTLSFAQIAIILLALFDVWKLVEFLKLRNTQPHAET